MLAFLLPYGIVLTVFTALDWLDSPLLTVGSFLHSMLSSVIPSLLAGFSGLSLYITIKAIKHKLRSTLVPTDVPPQKKRVASGSRCKNARQP